MIGVRDYHELVDGLRKRRVELGLSPNEVDRRAGLRAGTTARLESRAHALSIFNERLMQPLFDVLGVELVVVTDEPVRMPVHHEREARHGMATAA
jgi:hypothetical protein